ncbi:YggS family pyridoxal phosphate-dependent enzyme [Amycolatopsis taiwanensis]|uniref:Pyridoxal phosphate homeostasis protein n=1 Tax=Amycolatopsis taiwanensis TaxID=342230 RepID=A0A9W6VFB7_9PSEU|nr:YggS family pyridoxal phosphate-dependent enzyme [Amycolatopsis taiwanensis]GLY69413.1 YggS family pyridoxal phosphate enzyme [Amycolatopsis taiwanensis]
MTGNGPAEGVRDRPAGGVDPAERKAELAAALADLQARISRACTAAGRAREEVRLLAVTKTFPATDAALLADLGLGDFAENRDQEAAPKAAEFAGLRPAAAVRWHMVGRLQRNKARSVTRWAGEVQSVDSARLADALDRAARAEGVAPLDVLVQASIDGDPARGGCPLPDLEALADHIAGTEGLRLRGLMAVAPLGADPDAAFERLARAGEALRRHHPEATELSAGMSGDLEQAIVHGSTCVRVGTALLGGRGLASP